MTSAAADDASLIGANATLAVLRSLTFDSRDSREDVVLVLPSLRPLARSDAIALLAGLPKPVSCVSMALNDTLVIGWLDRRPVNDGWLERRQSSIDELLQPFSQQASRSDEPEFTLLSRGERQRFGLAACRRWFQDYDFPLVHVSIASPTPDLELAGLAGIIRFGRARAGWLDAAR